MESNNIKSTLETSESGWSGLYRAAGVSILITVMFVLVDIALSFTGGDVAVGGMSAVDWFAHFRQNWFLGLRNFGFFNVINTTLTIPLFLALCWMHRRTALPYAALVLVLYLFSAAIYAANNRALTMLALSQQYAAAATEAQRSLLAAAGTAILAQAEDFTPGSFVGLFLSSISSLLMTSVMLRGGIFRRWVALTGLVGTSLLLVFIVCATFLPATFNLAMILALAGGILMLVWNIRMGLEMLARGRVPRQKEERLSMPARTAAGER